MGACWRDVGFGSPNEAPKRNVRRGEFSCSRSEKELGSEVSLVCMICNIRLGLIAERPKELSWPRAAPDTLTPRHLLELTSPGTWVQLSLRHNEISLQMESESVGWNRECRIGVKTVFLAEYPIRVSSGGCFI